MAAGQLAVQDYLSRVGAAARDPAHFAALQAQALAQGGSKHRKASSERAENNLQHLKLPSDTEIVKSVAGSQGGRAKPAVSDISSVSIPNIPPGLTIERKKPGRKPLEANYHLPSSGQVIDRVEITKIPLANGSSSAPLDMSSKARPAESEGEAPLNLSMKSESEAPLSLTKKRKDSTEKDGGFPTSSKIPSDYYACKSRLFILSNWNCLVLRLHSQQLLLNVNIFTSSVLPTVQLFPAQALSGVFLAEQIRQQQLASELQNHLHNSNSSLAAMQALLSLGGTQVNGAAGGGNDTKRKQVFRDIYTQSESVRVSQVGGK